MITRASIHKRQDLRERRSKVMSKLTGTLSTSASATHGFLSSNAEKFPTGLRYTTFARDSCQACMSSESGSKFARARDGGPTIAISTRRGGKQAREANSAHHDGRSAGDCRARRLHRVLLSAEQYRLTISRYLDTAARTHGLSSKDRTITYVVTTGSERAN